MRAVMLTLACLLLAGLLGGTATVALGLFNVSAQGGHWPGVYTLLHTTYRNSVRLRAPDEADAPDINDKARLVLGARHYQQACVQCHGKPGERQSRTMQSMLPAPPPIRQAVEGWQANHLYWIVKHGIKMSGMPHWPDSDDDQGIWSVVAFLSHAGEMDAQAYSELLAGEWNNDPMHTQRQEQAIPETLESQNCLMCHGYRGASDNAYIPRLDILSQSYLAESLRAYRSQSRGSGIMQQAASGLDDETITKLARHYASPATESGAAARAESPAPAPTELSIKADEFTIESESIQRGERLAQGLRAGQPDDQTHANIDNQNIARPGSESLTAPLGETMGADAAGGETAACNACHGPWPAPLNERYPALAGQPEAYLLEQMKRWKNGSRGGTELSRMMHSVMTDVELSQLQDLAAYYASLPAQPEKSEHR